MESIENIDFKQVYVTHYSKMKRFAKEYVLMEEEAENIVQDVFLHLWENREIIRMPVNLLAFLFTATKNRCMDYLKHKNVVMKATGALLEEQKITMEMNLEALEAFDQAVFAESDIETLLTNAIHSLPEKCRDIFIKIRLEGKKHKEVANELNISTHTIEAQMNIALKKLREQLKNYLLLLIFIAS
jgi:RNA polymerase sigma-70 factor (ECF subfamily)